MKPTLVIADDHKIIRDGLKVLIERDGRYEVIGETGNGRELIGIVGSLRPDLVLTDLAMPELNGVEAVRQLRTAGFAGGVIMLSQHDERRHVVAALEAGVDAYVLKDYAFEQVLEAAEAALQRLRWLSPQLAAIESELGALKTLPNLLTPRELSVLQLIGEGHGTKEIAAALKVSPKTIEVHRLNLMRKLKVNSAVALARVALREGISRN